MSAVAYAAYKLGSFYFAGVHGFDVDKKRATKWLTLAKELSNSSGMLEASELDNIHSYLNKLKEQVS